MLEIRNVHKTFNLGTINEKHALNGVNLKLDAGDFVTVIGGNGAGKSTVLNAVAGTWPVDEGSILIDGVDVSKIGLYTLRSNIAIISQESILFSGTIRYNIDPFNEYEDCDIWAALEVCQ